MIKDKKKWDQHVKINTDSYGKACVDVARRVMEILDEGNDFNTHEIICQAADEVADGDLTGFMAGYVASMVSQVHSRGEEFRKQWNVDNQIRDEGEKANEKESAVLNPAIMTIKTPE